MECLLTTSEVAEVFQDVTNALGATVFDSTIFEGELFARAVTEDRREVDLGDIVQGGMCLHKEGAYVQIRPFVLRQICANGASMALSDESTEIDLTVSGSAEEQRTTLERALAECASAKCLDGSADQISRLKGLRRDSGLQLMSIITAHKGALSPDAVRLMATLWVARRLDAFEVMNALTAAGKLAESPRERWDHESLGGSMVAVLMDPDEFRHQADSLQWPEIGAPIRQLVTADS
jgi:hypothetical protein